MSRSTTRATSTPPRSTPGSACRSSAGSTHRSSWCLIRLSDHAQTKRLSARLPERLDHSAADRLGGLGHHFLGQSRKLLELIRRHLELLALIVDRHFHQL